MSSFQASYSPIALILFVSGILFFIDGMLLWSIVFFSLALVIVLIKIMWDIARVSENIVRKFIGDE